MQSDQGLKCIGLLDIMLILKTIRIAWNDSLIRLRMCYTYIGRPLERFIEYSNQEIACLILTNRWRLGPATTQAWHTPGPSRTHTFTCLTDMRNRMMPDLLLDLDSRDRTRYCMKDVAWNTNKLLKHLLPICNTFASFWNNSTRITNICNIQMVTHQNCSWSCWTIIPKGTWFWFQEICICFLICFACF